MNMDVLRWFFFILILLFLSLSCSNTHQNPDNANRIQIVEDGAPLQVVVHGKAWKRGIGSYFSSGIFSELYGNVYIKDADFRLKAKISLESIDSSTALCLLFNNHFGFDSRSGKYTEPGYFFFYNKRMQGKARMLAPSNNFMKAGVPFLFEIIREDTLFTFLVDQDTVAQLDAADFYPPLEGYIGLRPWENTMRVYNWSIEGELALPPKLNYIFSAGESDYTCFRIPAILKTKDGTLLAFAEGRRDTCQHDYGDIDLVLKRSKDAGKTWGPLEVLINDGKNTVGNPVPILDENSGTIVLLYTRNLEMDGPDLIKSGTSEDTRRAFVIRSSDNAQNWSEPEEITSAVKKPEWRGYATGPGSGIQLKHRTHAGRLIAACYHTRQDTVDYQAHIIYSDDGGLKWNLGGIVPRRGVNESELAELPDGSLIINMRNAHYKKKRRQIAKSYDGGAHWVGQYIDSALVEPQCQGSLLYWEAQNLLLFSNPEHEELRVNLTLKASETLGKQWQRTLNIHKGPAAYSDLLVLNEQEIVCLYEAGTIWPYQGIVFKRIDAEDLNGN